MGEIVGEPLAIKSWYETNGCVNLFCTMDNNLQLCSLIISVLCVDNISNVQGTPGQEPTIIIKTRKITMPGVTDHNIFFGEPSHTDSLCSKYADQRVTKSADRVCEWFQSFESLQVPSSTFRHCTFISLASSILEHCCAITICWKRCGRQGRIAVGLFAVLGENISVNNICSALLYWAGFVAISYQFVTLPELPVHNYIKYG